MEEQDYLVHYGVLGMKWGVRKDRNYKYTSMRTKHLTKKATKAKAKGKKNAGRIAEKLKASKKTDKNLLAYAKKTSVGKALAQDILLGPGGAKSYQTMRANGTSRGAAITSQILTKVSSIGIGFFVGSVAGQYLGKGLVSSLGLDNIPVTKQMEFYTKELQKLMNEGFLSDVVKNSNNVYAGRSKKLPWSITLDHVQGGAHTLHDSKTMKVYEDLLSEWALNAASNDIKKLENFNSKMTRKITDASNKFAQTVGAFGPAYAIGTRQKKKKK